MPVLNARTKMLATILHPSSYYSFLICYFLNLSFQFYMYYLLGVKCNFKFFILMFNKYEV